MKYKFGLSIKDLKEKQLYYLMAHSCPSAKSILEQRYRTNSVKLHKIRTKFRDFESSGIIFNKIYDALNPIDRNKTLINIREEIKNMPMRSLINPFIGKTLNKKLSRIHWENKIIENEYAIRKNNLQIEDNAFTVQDINQIRFSIIFLNNFKHYKKEDELDMCVSQDALRVFVSEGIEAFIGIAKGNRRYFKKTLLKYAETDLYNFLSFASMQFNEIWWKKLTPRDREKFPKAYDRLIWSDEKNFGEYPIYYLFSNELSMDIDRIEYFFKAGLTKINHVKLMSQPSSLVFEKDIFKNLHQSFRNYKKK